jgi:predicted phage terminase large subunit-like protein
MGSIRKLTLIKQSLDEWLDGVNYADLNSEAFIPSEFALTFMNFIKLANGRQGESHKTPPVHLKMLDKIAEPTSYIANLCFRGAAKTTLFGEYLFLFIGLFGALPNFGDVSGIIYVSDSMDNGVKSMRKNIEFRYYNSPFLMEWIPKATFTDNYIEFENKEGHRVGIKMFGAKTGLRGTKIFGKRPTLCVMDDLVSDDDSKSRAAMIAIKDTVYKGVDYALDPTRRKVIFNGTPFNTEDILIEAVESGAWDVNVWPVCEKFPCREEEFQGAWPDRFTYTFVKEQYDRAALNGKLASFFQELMLRITSEEERLVQDAELKWYSRSALLASKGNFNFYITTDFATSERQTADFTVISVWAYNANGDWFWVDGICERQTIDKSFDDLFRLVQEYKPQAVGVEVSGQQQAYISILQKEQMVRNIWFNFASSEKSGSPGIRPMADKLTRFNLVVPWFKAGKIYWPEEMKTSRIIGIAHGQIKLVTNSGIKGKDDFIDTISMLGFLTPWRPSDAVPVTKDQIEVWEEVHELGETSGLASYIV